jgi:DUF2946 family protein
MSSLPAQLSPGRGHFWRQLIGVVTIYAVIFQSAFLGFAGAPLWANASADEGLPAFELCLTGAHGAPLSPADQPGHHGDTHCIFCFAGVHHSLTPPPHYLFQQVNFEIGNVWWSAASWRPILRSEYSIARPRGPPVSA